MATVSHMAVCEGVLGSLPLLDQFPSGFFGERFRSESDTMNSQVLIQAELYCRSLLKLGIIAMLQGEPGYACTRLTQAVELSESRYPDVYAQAIAYLIQCRYMQFKWSAAGSYVSGVELDDIFDFITEIKHLQASLESANAYEHDRVRRLTGVLELQRWVVSARPSVPTSVQIALARNQGTEGVVQAIRNCRLSGVEEDKMLPLEIELAHLYRVVGDHDRFHRVMDSVVPLKPTDFILRAHHELRMGDAKGSTFGAPETWNMLLEQGTESNAQPRDDENAHFAMPPLEDLQAAVSHYLASASLYRTAQHTRGQAAVQLRLGYLATLCTFRTSSTTSTAYKVALAHVDRAKLLYNQAGDFSGVQVATAHSCLCRVGMGQFDKFPEDRDAAKAIGQDGKEKGSYSLAFGLGLFFAKYARRWLVYLGDYEKALAAHKLAAAVFDGLELKLSYAYSISDLLSVHELLGDQDMIYITAMKASNVCHEIEQKRPRTSQISQRALNHAVHILGKIFQHASKRADPDRLAQVANKLREWRRPDQSVPVEELQSRVFEVAQKFQAAMNEGRMADMEELQARLESLNIDPVDTQTQGAYNLIDHFISMADALVPLYRSRRFVRNGELNEAKKLWEETESAIRARPTSESEVLLASLSVSKREFEAAAAHARAYKDQLIAAENRESVGTNQETEGLLRRKKWQEKTRLLNLFARVRLYDDARSLLEELELGWGPDWWNQYEYPVWENFSIIAQVSEGLGEYERACDYYEQAMEAFDKRRHALSVDDHKVALAGDSVVQDIYFGAAHAAARWHLSTPESAAKFLSPQVRRAFAAIERGKARSLLDLMEGAIPNHNVDGSVGSQWQKYRQLGTQLATFRSLLSRCYEDQHLDGSRESRFKTEIQEKEKELRELEKKLFSGEHDPTSTIGRVLSLPSLCRLLPADTALLEYCYSREKMVAWKITASGMKEVFVVDVPEACLEGHILMYHKACATESSATRDHDSWLADKLLPFESLDESRLIIVPYRCLHQLPFHALPYQGQLLMSNKTISYLPSASILGYLQPDLTPDTDISILAVGNPSNMRHKNSLTLEERRLKALPSADVEVKAIRKLIAGTRALTGPEATKEAVSPLLGDYRVLHFATHGSLSTEVPMLSAIHLADGKDITVEDLMWRHLRADLVVLSACKTGRGELTNGDDVIGFARALLAAGVKSVLVTLWSVDDDVTSFLMTIFYEHFKKGWSPAGALQAAQLATRQATHYEVQSFLAGLRDPPDINPEPGQGGAARRDRDISPEPGQGGAAHPENYSHPKYWAPFIIIGSGRKGGAQPARMIASGHLKTL